MKFDTDPVTFWTTCMKSATRVLQSNYPLSIRLAVEHYEYFVHKEFFIFVNPHSRCWAFEIRALFAPALIVNSLN